MHSFISAVVLALATITYCFPAGSTSAKSSPPIPVDATVRPEKDQIRSTYAVLILNPV